MIEEMKLKLFSNLLMLFIQVLIELVVEGF